MNIEIVPYVEVNGIRTFKDSEICNLYFSMFARSENIFTDGTVRNCGEFLDMFKHGTSMLYVIVCDKKVAGFAFLSNFTPRTAQGHFCIFKEYWGKPSKEIGRAVLKTWLEAKNDAGEYFLHAIYGVVPVKNQHAIKYCQAIGGRTVGIMPNAAWDEEDQKSGFAHLFYFVKEFIQ